MRLFLAAELDQAAHEACATLIGGLRRSLGDAASAIKWTAADNIHITLHFLGEVDRSRLDRLTAALGTSLPLRPFQAETTHLGAFPNGGPPKVVWLGLGAGADDLREVHGLLATRVRDAGLPTEDRPFSPHLTLGRVRDRDRGQVRPLRAQLSSFQVRPIGWRVDHVTLFQSDLSGPVPRYVSVTKLGLGQ